MKNNVLVLSITGKDRPGIIAAITRILYKYGCNIEDSSMTILENEFAMILIVAIPEEVALEEVERSIKIIERKLGLAIFTKKLTKDETQRTRKEHQLPISISVYGSDKPGIVYNVSQLLADKNINITDLNTQIITSKGRPVYVMMLEATMPEETSFSELEKELAGLSKELSVNITLNKIEDVAL